MFTPKGLLVRFLTFLMSLLTKLAGALPAPIIPKPPAFETAAASSAVATQAMPPCIIGYSIPSISHISVLNIATS